MFKYTALVHTYDSVSLLNRVHTERSVHVVDKYIKFMGIYLFWCFLQFWNTKISSHGGETGNYAVIRPVYCASCDANHSNTFENFVRKLECTWKSRISCYFPTICVFFVFGNALDNIVTIVVRRLHRRIFAFFFFLESR